MDGIGNLELEVVNEDSQLVMDLFFPYIIRGKDAMEMSANELLEKLKEVDGAGSGLDADTLDGKSSEDFLLNNSLPQDEVVVGGGDGAPVGGGSFSDFTNSFNKVFNVSQ